MNPPSSPPDQAQPLPREFGRYNLFDRIGVGGMAEIYLARARTDLGAARLVVVKQILGHLSGNEKFSDMLIAEAKLAARLNHANVVQVFDLGRQDDILFIAMEYVEGFDLNELLKRCSKAKLALPFDFSLLVVMEALRGLDYAHRRCDEAGQRIDLVHRDVSPSNVLISFEGEIKLCDFGIARANDMADVLADDTIRGKAGYMSPEQARGEGLDCRADIFSAGVILWELLSGRKLYRAPAGSSSLLELARNAQIAPFASRGLPNEDRLQEIVAKALTPNREDRYESALSFLRDLENYAATTRQIASPIRFGEWLREHFEAEILHSRKARERAAKAIEFGPALLLKTIEAPMAFEEEEGDDDEPTRQRDIPTGNPGPVGDVFIVTADSRRHQDPVAELDVTTDPPPAVANRPQAKLPLGVRERMQAEEEKAKREGQVSTPSSHPAPAEGESRQERAPRNIAVDTADAPKALTDGSSRAKPTPGLTAKRRGLLPYIALGFLAGLIAVAIIAILR